MNIHPSLIIHYFKTKHNLTVELFDLLMERYAAPEFLQFDHIKDPHQRFEALMDTLFSLEYSRTVDPGVHFGFYYLSFRNTDIKKRFQEMINQLKVFLVREFDQLKKEGIVTVKNIDQAADMVITLIEGLEFQTAFLDQRKTFENFAEHSKKLAVTFLTRDM
jgi:AcrR family transcriptional regulator